MALNIGNQRMGIAIFAGGELCHTARVPLGEPELWQPKITEAWAVLEGHTPTAVVGACVNPPLKGAIEAAVEAAVDRRIAWVGSDIDLPIHVATENPRQTGIDRVLNIAAAYDQMEHACVVVDAGTAITVDCCNDKGDFLGGAIAPGLAMMLDALHEKTAQLPRVEFAKPQGAFGASTPAAILHGVYHGIRGMVKELVENYATELGVWPEIIATGGDAEKLFAGWELVHAVAPDLTFFGIANAYTEHHIKHGT